MTAYQFSQPWLSELNGDKEMTASEFSHLRKYLQGIDDGTTSLFNPHFLNATIDNLTISSSTTITGNITIIGNIIFSPTTNGIKGTTTNDNASAGLVGEYVSSNQTTSVNFPGATSVYANSSMSLSLTAGDWDVSGIVVVLLNGATMSQFQMIVTTTTGGSGTMGVDNVRSLPPSAGCGATLAIPSLRFSLSGTTTVYLVLESNYSSGNPVYQGSLHARRVR